MRSRRPFLLILLLSVFLSGWAAAGPEPLPVPTVREDAVQTFPYLLSRHTRTFTLPPAQAVPQSGGPGFGTTALIVAPTAAATLYEYKTLGSYGGASSSWLLAGSLLNTAMMVKTMHDMEKYTNPSYLPGAGAQATTLSLTLWDGELVDAKTLYFAEKDVVSDVSQIESYRQTLLSQYPVGDEIVIEVRITNGGLSPVSLSPFSWHLYLLDSRGLRYKPAGYDAVLDQAVQPGQTVIGKVYFPRVDPASHADLEEGSIRGILEDINGKTFHFSFR